MHSHRNRRKFARNAWPFIAMMAASKSGAFGGPAFGSGIGSGFRWSFDDDMPRRGPGGRRGRMFGPGELRLVLLALVAEEPRHGYELIKAIEEMTGGDYAPSPGTIYPTLSLLQDEGAIAEAASDDTRKAYEATEAGRAELAERADEVAALMERLSAHGEKAKGSSAPHDLFRAAGNLANVLKHKYRSGGIDDAVRQEIVDMIDELAKRIERL
jgi:DNA-binding PadR family transcriptional regulator